MILNYDKDNGFSSILDKFRGLKTEIPDITSEVKDLFSGFDSEGPFRVFLDDMVQIDKLKDTNFKTWVDGLKDTEIEAMDAGVALDKYKEHLKDIGKVTTPLQKTGAALKSVAGTVGSFALNMGASMLISAGVSALVTAIDNYIHRNEIAIEKGEKAQETISAAYDKYNNATSTITDLSGQFSDNVDEINNTSDAIDGLAEKYTELRKGVNSSTNENISLSTDEYQNYLDISNQLADLSPTLVNGYDRQGNAILNLGSNASSVASALQEVYDIQRQIAHATISQNINDTFAGAAAEVEIYSEKNQELQGELTVTNGKIEESQKTQEKIRNQVNDLVTKGSITFDSKDFENSKARYEDYIKYLEYYGIEADADFSHNERGEKIFTISIDEKELDKFKKDCKIVTGLFDDMTAKFVEDEEELQATANSTSAEIQSNDLLKEETWKSMIPSAQQFLQTSDTFSDLSNELQNGILGSLNNVDFNTVYDKYAGNVKQFLYQEYISPLSDLTPQAQKAITGLFDLDPSDMSIVDYAKKANNILSDIFGNNVEEINKWKERLGVNETLEDAGKKIRALTDKLVGENWYSDEITKLSGKDLELAYKIVIEDGNFNITYQDLMDKIEKLRNQEAVSIDINTNEGFDAATEAQNSENAGDKYLNMMEMAKKANELAQKGLTGTDDFKSINALFSPNGMTGIENWKENWPTIKRYFTEGTDGLNNFLQKLKSLDMAEYSSDTDSWKLSFDDLEEAANATGLSFEAFMAICGRLEDYGFINNFVGSVEQGTTDLSDLYTQLGTEEAKLAKLRAKQAGGDTTVTDTVIAEQEEKVANLRQSIAETGEALNEVANKTAEDRNNEIEGAKAGYEALAKERQKLLDDPDMYGDNTDAIRESIEKDMQAIADEYGWVLNDLFEITSEIPTLSIETNYTDLEVLQSKAESSKDTVQDLINESSHPVELNFDVNNESDIENQLAAVLLVMDKLRGDNATLDLSTPGAQEALNVFNLLIAKKQELNAPTFMKIDTSQLDDNTAHVIELFQQFQSYQQQLEAAEFLQSVGIEVDTSGAEDGIASITSQINELEGDQFTIAADVIPELNSGSVTSESIAAQLGTVDVPVKLKIPPEAIMPQTVVVNYTKGEQEEAETQEATVNYALGTQALPKDKSAKVDYLLGSQALPEPKHTKVIYDKDSEADGTAHASGTANTSKKQHHIPTHSIGTAMFKHYLNATGQAHANGHWGLKKNETALINELGAEIVVSKDGNWRIFNDGYPTFADLKVGDIIFNHEQSEQLLKHGYVRGSHAKMNGGVAYGFGTATIGGHAYAGAGGGNGPSLGGSSSSSSSSSNTKATQKNTKATESNTKATENLQDWIEYSTNLQSKENDRLYDAIESFEMHANQNKAIDAYVTDSQSYMNTLRNAQNAYMSKANSLGLDSSYIHKIWAGDDLSIENIQDETLLDKISKYQDYYEKAKDLGDQMTELNQKIRETKISKLDNIQDDYDNLVSYTKGIIDYNEAVNDLFESRNLVGNQDALMNNINQQMAIRQALVNEQKELTDQLNALVASGDIAEYTDTWLKWKTEINDVKASIVEADSALEELKQSIMEIRYKSFEDSLNNLDFNSEIFSSIRDLMSQEGIYDDDIKLTDSGITQLALMEQELVSAKQKVANYNTAIESLAKDLAHGNITQAQFNEKLQEYQKDQLSAVKATKDARDAILDLVKEGIKKQSEAVQELIQKRKEDLSVQKEYYDFQKKMNDKSKEMNKVRAQLAALDGDNSLETVAKRKKLMSQLQELEEEYNEDLLNRKYDLEQDAYDKTNDLTKENEEKSLKELETNLNVQNEAIANALEVTKVTYASVYEQLSTLADQYNFTLTDSLTSPWMSAQSAIDSYQQAIGKLQGNVSIDTSKIQGTTPSNKQTVPTKNEAATQSLGKSSNGTWLKQGEQWWYQHSDGGWTNNGWEFIDGRWYKFDGEGWMQSGWQAWGKDSTGQDAWYYMGDPGDGSMKTSTWVKGNNGEYYYVDHSGVMARDGYVKSPDSGVYYWVNSQGVWEPQWDTYNPNLNKYKLYYNTGKKRVPRNAMAYMDDTSGHKLDLGSEAIITDKGVLVQMDAGDMVFNKAQKKFLYEFSKKQIPIGASSMLSNTNTNFAGVQSRNVGNIDVHYDNLIGNIEYIDKNALPDLQTILQKSFDYNVKELRKYNGRLR